MMEILPAGPHDTEAIVALFRRSAFALQQVEWHAWKYGRNPFGPARTFKLVQNGHLAGAVALVPRQFSFRGETYTGLQAVDGLMGPEIRGKGLFNDVMHFLRQQRPEAPDERYFFLSFPSLASSVKAHERAGWQRLADFQLYTIPLTRRFLARSKSLARLQGPSEAAFWLLRSILARRVGRRAIRVRPISRFTASLNGYFSRERVFGDRSAAFMNWRVVDNPQADVRGFAIVEGGEDAGYAVGKLTGTTLELVDVKLAANDPAYLAALLLHLMGEGTVDAVDYWLVTPPGYLAMFPRFLRFHRPFSGAVFVDRVAECGLPTGVDGWDVSYLDSDW